MSEPTPDSSGNGSYVRLFFAYLLSVALVVLAERLGTYSLFGFVDLLDRGSHVGIVTMVAIELGRFALLASIALTLSLLFERFGFKRVAHYLPRVIAVLVFAAIGVGIGSILRQGAWISAQSWNLLLPVGFAALFAIVTAFMIRVFTMSLATSLRSFCVGIVLAIATGLAIGFDIHAMQGTYAEAHFVFFTLGCAAMLAAGYLLSAVNYRPASSRARFILQLVCGLAIVGLFTISARSEIDEQSRSVIVLRSPIAANVMSLFYPEIETTFLAESLAVLDPHAPPFEPDRVLDTTLENGEWNILLIVVDTLRADVLFPARTTEEYIATADTPFLNGWMADAVTFKHAYAQAAATHRSMPAMFQSLEVGEKAAKIGIPIADQMAATGRSTFAVVNNFFFEPRFAITRRLLENFERVSVYEKREQEKLVPQLAEQIQAHSDKPFFGWVHFYNMHEPGFDGSPQSTKVPLKERYRKSLRWLDAEMKKIDEELRKAGVADRTVVVLTADHGEGLGDNHIKNHTTVFEEEIRVPLAIRVPGVEGRVVEETAGNIDILPTLLDLIGEKPNPLHRGRSLVPAFKGEKLETRTYYMQDYKGKTHGTVIGRQKLFFREKSKVFHRFDLSTDPKEEKNLYRGVDPIDERLRRALIEVNPKLVKSELKDEMTAKFVVQKLDSIDANRPGRALRFLLRLAATSKSKEFDAPLVRLFEETDRDDVRALIYAETCRSSKPIQKALDRHLQRISATGRVRLLDRIAALPCPQVKGQIVAGWMMKIDVSDLDTYLLWVSKWKKNEKTFLPVWERWIAAPALRNDTSTLRALLRAIAGTKWKSANTDALKVEVRKFVKHPVPGVATAAITCAGKLGDEQVLDRLRRNLTSPDVDIQIRQASIHAVARIKPDDAVEVISAAGDDNLLVLDAIKALRALRDPAGLVFLDRIGTDHYNRIIRNIAKSAAKSIRKISKQKK